MKRHEIREKFDLGGPGSGYRGHTGGTGGPGKPGGSTARSVSIVGLGRSDQMVVEKMLKGVSPQQLSGLQSITTETPKQYPNWNVPAEISPTGKEMRASAAHDPETNTIHINPKNPLFTASFAHELGHHVITGPWSKTDKAYTSLNLLHSKHKDAKNLSSTRLSDMGLKKHSISNALEFQAEVWRVYLLHSGTPRAEQLAGFLGVSDLGEVYG